MCIVFFFVPRVLGPKGKDGVGRATVQTCREVQPRDDDHSNKYGPLDIFETPVTVTPQQEISKTLNSSNIP